MRIMDMQKLREHLTPENFEQLVYTHGDQHYWHYQYLNYFTTLLLHHLFKMPVYQEGKEIGEKAVKPEKEAVFMLATTEECSMTKYEVWAYNPNICACCDTHIFNKDEIFNLRNVDLFSFFNVYRISEDGSIHQIKSFKSILSAKMEILFISKQDFLFLDYDTPHRMIGRYYPDNKR